MEARLSVVALALPPSTAPRGWSMADTAFDTPLAQNISWASFAGETGRV